MEDATSQHSVTCRSTFSNVEPQYEMNQHSKSHEAPHFHHDSISLALFSAGIVSNLRPTYMRIRTSIYVHELFFCCCAQENFEYVEEILYAACIETL